MSDIEETEPIPTDPNADIEAAKKKSHDAWDKADSEIDKLDKLGEDERPKPRDPNTESHNPNPASSEALPF